MRICKLLLSVGLVAFSLAACGARPAPSKVCGSSIAERPANPQLNDDTRLQAAVACVERWSARLAQADDSADVIAEAVIATCHQEIERFETGAIRQYGKIGGLDQETCAYWRGKAMFVALQVKAADCYPDA